MFGSFRVTLLDRSWAFGLRAARWAGALVHCAAGRARWRPTDLYAAAVTAHLAASHRLIEQAADAADDGVTAISARTWPLLGSSCTFVFDEEDQ
ncbi:hypothetical protein ACF082_18925 [Streptomyces lydicus]|uniref:hypothetical protein n=1 Tax=Streptomyces lydicus TaxID=47763 RepID=UPI003700E306